MSLNAWKARAGVFAGAIATAVLLGVYARGGIAWVLGFLALVPWLLTLDQARTLRAALLSAWLMSVAFALAVFGWFGTAIGSFTGLGALAGWLLLALLAPLLQPQVLAYAGVRWWAGSHLGAASRALVSAAAWVATEWLWPKLLGDTLGHGLIDADAMRQLADLGGASGLTLLLILCNEAVATAWSRRRGGAREFLLPLALAGAVPALLWTYGTLRLAALQSADAGASATLRIGMVQASIVNYEELRRERGSYAVVRDVLDTHFALSRAAIEHHGVDALLWSETVYPTTFGHPRSEDGARLDQEILDFAASSGISLVFGTYDVDDAGEYNAAAFVLPGAGLLGYYRKSQPFPLTEHVPPWLDGPLLRRWLPWTGNWQPGTGARVFPLRAADGRELQVLPLICLDDVHPQLAIDGARLGAQAIIGLSNDAWFSANSLGARLHLSVAAFRSIETRLPQLRVTSNGLSAFVDPTGEVVASTQMGDRAVLAGELPIRDVAPTLIVHWGDWVGGLACGVLGLMLVTTLLRSRLRAWRPATEAVAAVLHVRVWPRSWRVVAALLRLTAVGGLLALLLPMWRDGFQVNSLHQLQTYAWLVLLPLGAAWVIGWLHAARARVDGAWLILDMRTQRIEIPLADIRKLQLWLLPLPGYGLQIEFVSGRRWPSGIQLADPHALLQMLTVAGAPAQFADAHSVRIADYARWRAAAIWRWLDHPVVKFGCFPLVAALPAFRLHQYIAFGGTFGEWYTFGAQAWLLGLAIWWAAWSIGLMLYAAALRVSAELLCLVIQRLQPQRLAPARHMTEIAIRALYYLGVPVWLGLQVLGG